MPGAALDSVYGCAHCVFSTCVRFVTLEVFHESCQQTMFASAGVGHVALKVLVPAFAKQRIITGTRNTAPKRDDRFLGIHRFVGGCFYLPLMTSFLFFVDSGWVRLQGSHVMSPGA